MKRKHFIQAANFLWADESLAECWSGTCDHLTVEECIADAADRWEKDPLGLEDLSTKLFNISTSLSTVTERLVKLEKAVADAGKPDIKPIEQVVERLAESVETLHTRLDHLRDDALVRE